MNHRMAENKDYQLEPIDHQIYDSGSNVGFGFRVIDNNDIVVGCISVHISRTCLRLWDLAGYDLGPENGATLVKRVSAIVATSVRLPISIERLKELYPECLRILITTDMTGYNEQTHTLHIPHGSDPKELIKHIIYDDNQTDEKIQYHILELLKDYREYSYIEKASSQLPKAEMPYEELADCMFIDEGRLLMNIDSLDEDDKITVRRTDQSAASVKINNKGLDLIKSPKINSTPKAPVTSNAYVLPHIIEGFKGKKSSFVFDKLIQLLEQLNQNYGLSNSYACAMLIRSVLDHTPPVLGYHTFKEVANNYSWGKTDKEYMQQLLLSRSVSDDALHRPISESQEAIKFDDLPDRIYLNSLLTECLKSTKSPSDLPERSTKKEVKEGSDLPIVELLDESVQWASNWSGYGPGFLIHLSIDNFHGDIDFVKELMITATDANGSSWSTKHFEYQKPTTAPLKIEPDSIQNVFAFLSDEKPNGRSRQMPDLDRNTLKLNVVFRSGKKNKLEIKSSWIQKD